MSNPTPQDRLIALINESNDKQWQSGQLTFGPVGAGSNGRNATVVATAAAGQPYSGNVTLSYNRVDLSTAPKAASTDFVYEGQTLSVDLVDALRARYNIALTAIDLVSEALPAPDGTGKVSATLKAATTSYLWFGQLAVTLTPAVRPLSEVLTNNVLDGFTLDDLADPQ